MGYLFPDRTDDEQDPDDYEPCGEPDEEQILEHLEALLASPRWCATSGQRPHPLTGVLEVDAVRAEVERLREALGLDEDEERETCPDCGAEVEEGSLCDYCGAAAEQIEQLKERETRQAEQDAYDAHADAAMTAERK